MCEKELMDPELEQVCSLKRSPNLYMRPNDLVVQKINLMEPRSLADAPKKT